jgi:Methyltransferase domain
MRADLERWNARYGGEFTASFAPHALAEYALALPLPAGPVLDLASGPSGTVLLAAASGRPSVAVDISDVALRLLRARVRAQRPAGRVAIVQADLDTWRPREASFALVLCTGYWDRALFAASARAVLPGGLLGWEALTTGSLTTGSLTTGSLTTGSHRRRPGIAASWRVRPGEPASLLPAGFKVLCDEDLPADGPATRTRLLARAGQDAADCRPWCC